MNVLAIDGGVTKTAAAIADRTGALTAKKRWATGAYKRENILNLFETIINEYKEQYDICAVGISTNGSVDDENGVVVYADDVSKEWTGVQLAQEIQKRCGLVCVVQNDGRAAVLGEGLSGAAKGCSDYFGIFLGTGTVGGYVSGGRLMHGANFGFGEVAHMVLHPDGRKCKCGQNGCVERYCSGTALYDLYNERTGRKLASGYEFFDCLRAGDKDAQRVIEQFKTDLALTAVSVVNLLDPGLIVVGGGLVDTREYWWKDFVREYQRLCSAHLRNVEIVPAKLGNDAALIGMAHMAGRLCSVRKK